MIEAEEAAEIEVVVILNDVATFEEALNDDDAT